jgi:hypothetical protein
MTLVAAIGAVVGVALDPSRSALAMAGIAVPPAALAAAAGAALSVLQGIQEPSATWDLAPPEMAGMRSVGRIIVPPLVAVVGCLPIVLARSAIDNDGDPFGAAATAALLSLVVTMLAGGWIHQREAIKAWFRMAQEQAGAAPPTRGREPAPARATSSSTRSSGRKPAATKVSTSLPRKR